MEIHQIKDRLSLADVLKHYGLKPDANKRLHCPFHEDKTPSMQVYWKEGTCFCFSSNCKTHGKAIDVIDFVMYMEQCNKHEALLKCTQMIEGSITPAYIEKMKNKGEFMNYIFTYFKNALSNSSPAKDYLQRRGLDYKLIEVGYNAAQFHHGKRKDEVLIKGCVDAGILLPYGYNSRSIQKEQAYTVFGKYCIVFALRNDKNEIESMYFRSTVNDEDQKHFYLKNRKGLYPGYPKKETTKLILTEAIIDAATLLQIPELTENYTILSTYGTNGLGEEHIKAIEKLKSLNEIIFSFDGDESGRTSTRKYAETLLNRITQRVEFTHIKLPEGEDVNSFYLKYESSSIIQLLDERESVFDSTVKFKEIIIPGEEQNKANEMERSDIPTDSVGKEESPVLDTTHPYKIVYTTEHAVYNVLGDLPKHYDQLSAGLQVEINSNDTRFKRKSRHQKVNFYEDRVVSKISADIAEKLQVNKSLIQEDLYTLTDLLEKHRDEQIQKNTLDETENTKGLYIMSSKEKEEAVNFLKQRDLIKQLIELLGDTGIVGEERNRIFLFLVAYSYKMKETLNVLLQGSSASGKTRQMKQVAACMPDEDIIIVTRISDKSLYNFPEYGLSHKAIFIEDYDGLSEEAEFALRELISNGMITSAISIKLDNGQITTGQRVVRGPISTIACTTKGHVYEDNMSRVFLVAVDESIDQTEKIITYQNQKAAGLIENKKEYKAQKFIKNIVRILEPLEVVNPYATQIQLPREAHKIRRLNDLFQNFIKQIVLLHQYQRKRDDRGRLIAEIYDVELAVNIMFESILLKVDELDGSLRQFFENLKAYLEKNYKGKRGSINFSLREVRQALHISKTQLYRYMSDLQSLEYVQQNGGFSNKGYTYKISYWDDYKALRERIKSDLTSQIQQLKNIPQN